jgi:signal transduction histidine kinase
MKPRLKRSLTPAVVMFAIVLAITIMLAVLWQVALVTDYNQIRRLANMAETGHEPFHWGVVAVGSTLIVAIIVLVSIIASQLFSEIRWNERQQNFIASVSHELNSPLSSIKLYAQTLQGEALTVGERNKFLSVILADVDRLAHLIRNILRAAQIDTLPVRTELVPLAPYLEAYVAEIGLQLAHRGRGDEIKLLPIDADLHAMLDRTLFRQVLDNLVDNAIKYSRENRVKIEIEARQAKEETEILVRDDGIGIPRSELKKIFDRFYRIEGDAQRSRKGTGLGLFIVRSIVELHDGEISAESEGPHRGSTFTITLPRTPTSTDEGQS